jgi:hypothetical protein
LNTRLTWLSIGVLLGVGLIIAGCGGDDSNAGSISKAEFVKKAEAVCKKGNKRMEGALAGFLHENKNIQNASKVAYEELLEKIVLPSLKRELREIRAIGVPSDGEERVEAMVAALEEGVETAEEDPRLAVTSSDAVFGISSRLARELGLDVCGSR